MKKLMFILLVAAFCVTCDSNVPTMENPKSSDYYWYKDTQILLERGNQEYIIFDDALLSNSDKEQLIESGNVSYTNRANLKWGVTKANAVIEDSEHVLYRAPSYKGTDDSNIYLTHRFYVKLKDSNDFSILQDMNEQYNTEIEEVSDVPLWYILRCGLPSSFNALELANIFYESGLFSAAEPEFMGGFSLDTANQYDTTQKKLYGTVLSLSKQARVSRMY